METSVRGSHFSSVEGKKSPSFLIKPSLLCLFIFQVFGCLFYIYYIFERLCSPLFRNIKQEPFSARVLVLCVFNSILPGTGALVNVAAYAVGRERELLYVRSFDFRAFCRELICTSIPISASFRLSHK